MIKICKKCSISFKTYRSWRQYCSYKCAMQGAWNTVNKRGNKNVSKRPEVRKKMSESAMGKHSGKLAYNWKGDKASYASIHMWVKAYYGKPTQCEHCGIKPPIHRIE